MANTIADLHLQFMNADDEKARTYAAMLDQISQAAASCAANLTSSATAQDAYTKAVIQTALAADGATQSTHAFLGATSAVKNAVAAHVTDSRSRVQTLTQDWGDLGNQIDKVSARSLVNFSNTGAKMFVDFITRSGNAKEAVRGFVLSIIEGIAQIVIRQILANTVLAAMHAAFAGETTATSAAAASESAAFWTPAAVNASIATLGGADIMGLTGYITALSAGQAIGAAANVAGKFAEGGLVPGWGSEDNFPSMLTPGELVIDRTLTSRIRDAMDNRTFPMPSTPAPVRAFAEGGPAQMIQQAVSGQRNMTVHVAMPDIHVPIGDKELDRIHSSAAATDAFKANVEVHADHIKSTQDKRRGYRS